MKTVCATCLEIFHSRGYSEAEPQRFCSISCFAKSRTGSKNSNWRGGARRVTPAGYVHVYMPNHPRNIQGLVFEHVLVAERAFGKYIDSNHPIHHCDENRSNNSNSNLVICEDVAYHKLIHRRLKAYKATGNPDFRKCGFCQKWDSPDALCVRSAGQGSGEPAVHNSCKNLYARNRRRAKRESAQTEAL